MNTIKPFPLRINDELREALQCEADAMNRSLNAEIGIRLTRSQQDRGFVVNYIVLREGTIDRLESAVCERLSEGWSLQGGVATAPCAYKSEDGYTMKNKYWYLQAMRKHEQVLEVPNGSG